MDASVINLYREMVNVKLYFWHRPRIHRYTGNKRYGVENLLFDDTRNNVIVLLFLWYILSV